MKVNDELQKNSASPSDISSKFKVNSQTLANTSIQSYSKDKQIITEQFSIHPFKIWPNHYLNMSCRNLIVKKLTLRLLNLIKI
ncbi:helix-turn-helix domain-containing protein [Arsenophonus endosymbiont of Aleurodicus floccissimus]|uniref:helix-turn-helix domain-containing protein n=1 Tax=Arsenophonus endosymbiont of Aleurodicus floccissimus TaxID=2152761 RepID=UPI000E6B08FC